MSQYRRWWKSIVSAQCENRETQRW